MNIARDIVVIASLLTVSALCCFITVYTARALAVADMSRKFIPVVGGEVGDRIEAWVLGAYEPDVIDELPPPVGDPGILPTVPPGTPEPIPTHDPNVAECARPSGLPVRGRITQGFHPGHSAVDISVVMGTSVHSTMCGEVYIAQWLPEDQAGSHLYGILVGIRNGAYKTYYAHNSQTIASIGQWVERGQTVALSGSTGRSTGPHVHYEVWFNGRRLNPLDFP